MKWSSQLLCYIMVILLQDVSEIYNKIIQSKRRIEAIVFNPVDKLQKTCVLKIFRHRLKKVRQLRYDEEIICDLLDAHAMVFQWHKHDKKDMEISILRHEIAYTAWERDKLAFYHGLGEKDKIMSQREEFLLAAMAQNIPVNIQQNIFIQQEVSKECVDFVFRQLSKDVSESDLKILNKLYSGQGKHNRQKASSAYEYLYNIWTDQNQAVELGSFVKGVLATPLNKPGLLENMGKYISEFHATGDKSQSSGQSTKSSDRRKNRHSGTGQSAAKELPQDQLQKILKKLEKIEKQTERREFNPYDKFMKGSPLENIGQLFPPSFLNGKYDSLNPEQGKLY